MEPESDKHKEPKGNARGNEDPDRKSFADIVKEKKKARDNKKEDAKEDTPTFLTSNKTAHEIFEEATGIIGIENVSPAEISKYFWQGENPDGEIDINISNDALLFSSKYSNERLEAAQGICIERYENIEESI